MPMTDDGTPVHILGAGPGGLATAAALKARGISSVVLEKSPAVGASWRGHHDGLRLHTTRARSGLPGLPIPRAYGRWVARDDMVRYLEAYTAHHGIEVATGVEVDTVERRDEQWVLHANGGRRFTTPVAVVATGYHHTAHLPAWPGRDSYPGQLLHSSRYRDPQPYEGGDVLVVGAGNTGTEIAVELVRGGAKRVRLAVRTPPHLVRRSTLGRPAQANARLYRRLPAGLADRLAARVARLTVPDLSAHGLPRPDTGLRARALEGALPVHDARLAFAKAVQRGQIEPVAAVESFDGPDVRLADGTTVRPDSVIAATGFQRGLEDLVGHLDVLDSRGLPPVRARRRGRTEPPGLYFTGYTNPITGALAALADDAERTARAIARATA